MARRSKLVGGMCGVLPYGTCVIAVMHLYNILNFFIASVHFLFYTFQKFSIDKLTEWSTTQRVLNLVCVLNRGNTERTNSSKFLNDVCEFFVLCGFVSGLTLWLLDNL